MNLNKATEKPPVYKLGRELVKNPYQATTHCTDVTDATIHTDNLETELIKVITSLNAALQSPADIASGHIHPRLTMVGCVAWFSNDRVLQAIKDHVRRVLFLVSDQDYTTWGQGVCPKRYMGLPRFDEPLWKAFAHMATPLAVVGKQHKTCRYDPVRAFGQRTVSECEAALRRNPNGTTTPRARKLQSDSSGFSRGPILHTKYLVFFDKGMLPQCVWLGSYNITANAGKNQEMGLLLNSRQAAKHLFDDFANTFVHSSPLYKPPTKKTAATPQKYQRAGRAAPCAKGRKRPRSTAYTKRAPRKKARSSINSSVWKRSNR